MKISYKDNWQLLQFRVSEKRISEAVVFFRSNNIEPILIKGWAAAQSFPEPFTRGFTDIDLMIDPKDYKKALKLSENFKDKNSLDLHDSAKYLDTLDFADLLAHSKKVFCGGTEIRVLCPEDHLRILCVHWLVNGGVRKDRLWDIYYAVENRPVDFDWERCLNVVSQTRRRWIACAVALAHKYLGLNLEETPFADEAEKIPRWVIETIESEWANGEPLMPLDLCLSDRKKLFRQIKKRFPPNPLQATIDMEGEFDERPRIFYQIGDIFLRLKPSIERIAEKLFKRNERK